VQNVENMDIAGVVKTSLCDYPGKVASVIFTSGCNFNCPYCHNHQLIKREENISEKEILNFLNTRINHIDGVVISGGEPCMQENIVSFCKKIKSLGFKIKLDTNGSYPFVLEELLNLELLDYVAMDIKAPIYKEKIKEITGINNDVDKLIINLLKSITELKNSNIEFEFRTTLIKELHSHRDIFQMSLYGQKNYKLQQFNNEKVNKIKYRNYTTYSDIEIEQICKMIKEELPLLNISHQ